MDARYFRFAVLASVLLVSMGASYRTKNFVVTAPDARLATEVGQAAEKYRQELAVVWLGKAMPNWSSPCIMNVRVGQNLGAGGATTFMFDRGEVYGWKMDIQGSHRRLLDSVLPHEITHMIMATRFRRPLPRWADEGAATSVEHISERTKYYSMLQKFLRSGRGISFSRMFAMTEYPSDVLPLYAQGFTLADFLIRQGGRQKFIAFVDDGLKTQNWPQAINRHYRCENLAKLQNNWLAWVEKGCPALEPIRTTPVGSPEQLLASNGQAPQQPATSPSSLPSNPDKWKPTNSSPLKLASATERLPRPQPNLIFRIPTAKNSHPNINDARDTNDARDINDSGPVVAINRPNSPPSPLVTQSARPQPVQKSRQIILEWRNR